MALVVADRIKETTTTTGTGTYTLAGAVLGFEAFLSIGNGNTTYYCCTDGTDFEVGIGTYTSSGTTLARTTVLQSSNSDNAVNWTAGERTIFVTQPAEKAVYLDASGYIAAFDGRNLTNVDAETLDSLNSTSFLRSDAADTKTSGNLTFNDNIKALFGTSSDLQIFHNGSNSIIYDGGTGELQLQTDGTSIKLLKANTNEILANFIPDGAVELYHDSNLKFSTTSTGATITGVLTADGLTMGDNENITLGDGSDFKIRHSGGASIIQDTNSSTQTFIQDDNAVRITTVNATQNSAIFYPNAQSELYNNGVKIFNTISTGAQITGDLTLTSTDDGATENPTIDLYRNSSSPADNDVLGHINFTGENDAGEKIQYAEIQTSISDASDGTEGARLQLQAMYAGTLLTYYEAKFGLNTFSRDAIFTDDSNIIFEGATNDAHETTLTVINPTSDNTIQLPDASGTVLLADGDGSSLTNVNATTLDSVDSTSFLRSDAADSFSGVLTATAPIEFNTGVTYDPSTTGDGTDTAADVAISLGSGARIVGHAAGYIRTLLEWNSSSTLEIGQNNTALINHTKIYGGSGGGVELYEGSSKKIETTSTGATVTGTLVADEIAMGDSDSGNSFANRIKLGAGNDLQIFHSGTASFISDTGTGSLFITGSDAISFNSGDYGETYATFNDDGAVTLRHDDSIKFSTSSTGATVTGVLTADGVDVGDNEKIRLGASQDLEIFHDGNSSLIDDTGAGSLFIRSSQVNIQNDPSLSPRENMATFVQNGAVTLMYDGSTKFNTSSTGGTITGDLTLNSTTDSGAVLKLVSNDPADAADFGIEGMVQFYAENDASESTLYYSMQLQTADISDGTEDGWLYLNSKKDGTLNVANAFGADGSMYILGSGNGAEGALKWFQTKSTSHTVSVKPNTPTADRNIFLPDADGTVALNQSGILNLTNSGSQSELRLYCESNNAHYASLKAPAHADFSGNITLTLPATTGTVLSTANADVATTTTSSSDADHVLINDGGVLKKITPSDLGIGSGGGGSGSSSFIGLSDTPSSYTASKFLKVNSGGTAVEFADSVGGGVFCIEGERSNGANANSYFAIGNGAQPNNGVYIPEEITLRYLALSADSSQTSATMSLYVNGSSSGQSVTLTNQAQNVTSLLNYTIAAGSRITFRMTSGSTNSTTVAVAWFANEGAIGPAGATGATGATGAAGPAGDNAYSGINSQTGTSYTAVASDEGKLVSLNNASPITFTIPPNSSVSYTTGVRLDIVQYGAGQVTVAGGSGVTVNSTPTLKLRAQYSAASCVKISTNEWLLVGDLAET